MIALRPIAEEQLESLRLHYEQKGRPESIRALVVALQLASDRIQTQAKDGLPAPRPYPEMAHRDRRWIKEGRYWIAYSTATPPVILAIFYDQANMPQRDR